jgi:hypothetical protein
MRKLSVNHHTSLNNQIGLYIQQAYAGNVTTHLATNLFIQISNESKNFFYGPGILVNAFSSLNKTVNTLIDYLPLVDACTRVINIFGCR